jgi:hypothetical protein
VDAALEKLGLLGPYPQFHVRNKKPSQREQTIQLGGLRVEKNDAYRQGLHIGQKVDGRLQFKGLSHIIENQQPGV